MSNNIVFGKRQSPEDLQAKMRANQYLVNLRKQPYSGLEKRTESRNKRLKACKIIFNNRNSIFDGVMLNLSSTGAMLEVENSKFITTDFILKTVFSGIERPCTTKWKTGNLIGVEFDDS